MKNILVVNVNWIGDVVFSLPVFSALRRQYPDARICCVAVPRVVPILEHCPAIDEVIVYDERGAQRWLWQKFLFVLRLRKFHFDIAFLLHRSWTRAFLIYLAGIRKRVGYDLKDLGRLLTHKVELPEGTVHRSDYYLHVLESYGIPVEDRVSALKPDRAALSQMDSFLALKGVGSSDFLVVVNVGGNWDLKRWPKDYFVMLVERLMRELKAKVIIPGAPSDVALAEEIRERSGFPAIVMAGKTNLSQLLALMSRADLVISSDSGPLHIASGVGAKVIGLFGPTRPEITGPRGKGQSVILQNALPCNQRACYQLDCPNNRCMKSVSVDDVMIEVQKIYRDWQRRANRTDEGKERGR